ncbi:hypothetical protein BV508_27340, partial [Mycobacterium intermedium]
MQGAVVNPEIDHVPDQIEYRLTQSTLGVRVHADCVSEALNERELALRKLPLPYSLALARYRPDRHALDEVDDDRGARDGQPGDRRGRRLGGAGMARRR